MSTVPFTPESESPGSRRYFAVGPDVIDTLTKRRAGFINEDAAREAGDWLNSPHVTAADYSWIPLWATRGDDGLHAISQLRRTHAADGVEYALPSFDGRNAHFINETPEGWRISPYCPPDSMDAADYTAWTDEIDILRAAFTHLRDLSHEVTQ